MFRWKKKGLLFGPDGTKAWMKTHAQVPYTVQLENVIRTYFSTREDIDEKSMFRSFSGYVDLDKNDFRRVLHVSECPIVPLGGKGEFDEFGSMAGSVVFHEGKYYLYYCGWTRCNSVPYNWAIGLATSDDAKSFQRHGRGPLLGSVTNEPYLQACPIVYKLDESNWHMFYLSGVRWFTHAGKVESQYLLMHSNSRNGLDWVRNGKAIIAPVVPDECQTSASIIEKHGKYHLFFSYRHGSEFRENPQKGYRIGYASSSDLVNWERDDAKAGLGVSDSGWDSEMVAYPHVFQSNGETHMFYCGNSFGRGGFGWATLETE
jgi:hypothetical protein